MALWCRAEEAEAGVGAWAQETCRLAGPRLGQRLREEKGSEERGAAGGTSGCYPVIWRWVVGQ